MSSASGMDTSERRKARGAFFTPPELCRYMAEWAIRAAGDAVLEPSCGEAAFLLAAADRLTGLGPGPSSLHGVDVHPASARRARQALAGSGHPAQIIAADFFTLPPTRRFDAVVGNPPFVRYQDFTGEARSRSRDAALRAGVNLTRLASSWAAFTVHSALFLKPGGRLALVLPAELLSVNYAAPVRRFLVRHFGRVRLVLFTERIFPGVLAEVVLLLADGNGGTDHCELLQVRGVQELLTPAGGLVSSWRPPTDDGKWTSALLPGPARAVVAAVTAHPAAGTLLSWGQTRLGAVTGNNGFFAISPRQALDAELLAGRDLVPLSPPGSRHLRGLALTPETWTALGEQGRSTWLVRPTLEPSGDLSSAARRYLEVGERAGVPTAYKCRVRTPWWRVPLPPPADLLLTYMNADTPRLVGNCAGVHHLNSVHGVYLRPELKQLGTDLLPLAVLNSVTLLGAETVGRSYGGGLLKLEPGEADRLPVPSPELVAQVRAGLVAIRGQVAAELAAGRLLAAVQRVDSVLLAGGFGLAGSEIAILAQARELLAGRRAARAGRPAQPSQPLMSRAEP